MKELNNKFSTYNVKAKVLIEVETDFTDNEAPTEETLKYCIKEDLEQSMDIKSIKILEFNVEEENNE